MLQEADKAYVIEELVNWVAPLDKPRATLSAPFVGTAFPQDLRGASPRELVMHAVQLCIVDAWNSDPPWLVLLVQLLPTVAVDSKLIEIVARARIKPPPTASPLDATVLLDGTPFVNRTRLRNHLRRLATPAASAKPILVVNGTAQSGKSYSSRYIEHFSYTQPPITTYRIEFRPDLGLEMGPEQVARDLVSMMGRPVNEMPRPDTNLKLYVRQLALWVLNEAAQSPSNHWFILDNFRGEKLRSETRDLLIAMSDVITTGVFPQRCRLILTGFDRALLAVDPGKVDEERIAACSNEEIRACVVEILKRSPQPLAAASVLPSVLSDLPEGVQRMKEVNLRLRALLRVIDRLKDILESIGQIDFQEVMLEILKDLPSGDGRLSELDRRLDELQDSTVGL